MSRKDYLGYLVLLVLHTGVAGAANIPAQTQSLSSASSSLSGFRAVATGIRMEEQPQAVYDPRYLDIMIPFYGEFVCPSLLSLIYVY